MRRVSTTLEAPTFRRYRGFDPASNTLMLATTNGSCLGPTTPDGTLIWVDTAIRPEFGDVVLVEVRKPDGGLHFYGKQLERIAGKLWALSEDVPLPLLNPPAMRVVGVRVASMVLPGKLRESFEHDIDHGLRRFLLTNAHAMLSHVAAHGFEPRAAGTLRR